MAAAVTMNLIAVARLQGQMMKSIRDPPRSKRRHAEKRH
jgi:hypothetical protein